MAPDEIVGPKPGEEGWRPGTYRGGASSQRSRELEEAAIDRLEGQWYAARRYRRVARLTHSEHVTPTGTVRMRFEVIDDEPFAFDPGQFVGIEHGFEGKGFRRSPYCILSPPSPDSEFELLVRVVEAGPLSQHLGSMTPGDTISFRGPTGRSMVPQGDVLPELVLLATGVGIAPLYSLVHQLLRERNYERPITLYWGLRLVEDQCLMPELQALADRYTNFRVEVSLSQPPPDWKGLRGRITETVPSLLPTLGGKRFYLVGNGAMIEEMAAALSDMGVDSKSLYKEAYFNAKHRPAPTTVAAIRSRFVADDLLDHTVQREASEETVRRVMEAATQAAGPSGSLAASNVFELLPSLLAQDSEEAAEDPRG
jgi:ferredoxin-NADP reductase